ncbi:hypothetical protein WR25_24888 [Diploscapter pachys]|uniref:C2H2-type domain-containing protein n=1 Tax=Diploscapter pachys TaxID=2018661 RepID=A0A2A2LHQ2_9BILA|nr:hypothetical protein WR25_24888 [Diploscapter pachys]
MDQLEQLFNDRESEQNPESESFENPTEWNNDQEATSSNHGVDEFGEDDNSNSREEEIDSKDNIQQIEENLEELRTLNGILKDLRNEGGQDPQNSKLMPGIAAPFEHRVAYQGNHTDGRISSMLVWNDTYYNKIDNLPLKVIFGFEAAPEALGNCPTIYPENLPAGYHVYSFLVKHTVNTSRDITSDGSTRWRGDGCKQSQATRLFDENLRMMDRRDPTGTPTYMLTRYYGPCPDSLPRCTFYRNIWRGFRVTGLYEDGSVDTKDPVGAIVVSYMTAHDFEVVKGKPHGNCSKAKKDSVFISTPRSHILHLTELAEKHRDMQTALAEANQKLMSERGMMMSKQQAYNAYFRIAQKLKTTGKLPKPYKPRQSPLEQRPADKAPEGEPGSSNPMMVSCSLCGFITPSIKTLEYHICRFHLNWTPWRCMTCLATLSTCEDLADHCKKEHDQDKPEMVFLYDKGKNEKLHRMLEESLVNRGKRMANIAKVTTPTTSAVEVWKEAASVLATEEQKQSALVEPLPPLPMIPAKRSVTLSVPVGKNGANSMRYMIHSDNITRLYRRAKNELSPRVRLTNSQGYQTQTGNEVSSFHKQDYVKPDPESSQHIQESIDAVANSTPNARSSFVPLSKLCDKVKMEVEEEE